MLASLLGLLLVPAFVAGDPPPPAPDAEPSYADHPLSWWIDRLDDRESAGVAQAVLRMMGAEAAPSVVAALERADRPRRRTLLAAFDTLVRMAERTAPAASAFDPALEGLGRLLDDADPRVRALAQRLLWLSSRRPKAFATASVRLGSADANDRTEALLALRRAGSVEPAVARGIGGCLSDPVPAVRLEAARTLVELGVSVSPAVSSLLVARRSEDPALRALVLASLGHVRPVGNDALAALREGVTDAEASVRPSAIWAFADASKDSPEALGILAALTAGPDPDVRRLAAEGLKGLGPAAAPALPALGRALLDARPDVRAAAEDAILATGPAAKTAIPALAEAASRGLGGGGALYRIAPDAVPELGALLPGADAARRDLVLRSLRPVPAARLVLGGRVLLDSLAGVLLEATSRPDVAEVSVLLLARIAHAAPELVDPVARTLDAYLGAVARADLPEASWASGPAQFGRAVRGDPELEPLLIDAVARHVADATAPVARRVAVVRQLHSFLFRDTARVKALLETAARGSDAEVARMARETLDVILATEAAERK